MVLNHPRTYTLTANGDAHGFINDFNITATMSLLKWVVFNSNSGQCKIISPSGKIPTTVFDFAVNECYKYIKKAQKFNPKLLPTAGPEEDIFEAADHEWNNFLENYYKTVHVGNHFKESDNVTEIDMVRKANYILDRLKEVWPFLDMDGLMNIWILKPINSSQGIGIHMCRTLKYVLNVVKTNVNRRYVIQKYVERPLLIYNTKFDIRQWFLISSTVPLTIWMYKFCYLRFSSQTYNLRKLHESIHLTNNSVQSKYNKIISRDITLPAYNMWHSNEFQNYLSDIGYPKVFNDIIQPGMRQCIITSVLLHQNKLDQRKNTFELYGADFILTEDFKPWILEINSSPALHASTPITAKLCPMVLEDVIKVDYENNNRANTGGFELVYKGNCHIKPNVRSEDTLNQMYNPVPYYKDTRLVNPFNNVTKQSPVICIREIGIGMRNVLENLLEIVKKHKARRDNMSSTATTSSFIHNKRSISMETFLSVVTVPTQTLNSQLQLFQNDTVPQTSTGPRAAEDETHRRQQTKQYISNLMKDCFRQI